MTVALQSPLELLNGRLKRLDNFSYKLGETNQYGLDFVNEAPIVDEKRMSVRICFADGNRRDGVGDLLEVGGIRTERHRLNPIALFDHGKAVTLPIGLCEDPETKAYTVEIDPMAKTAHATIFFYQDDWNSPHALFCEQLFDLIAKKFIRGGSIGYQTIKAMHLQPDYNAMHAPAMPGLHLLVTLMLEASPVVMPANGDVAGKMLAMPKICGKAPSPWLIKGLSPYAPERKAQLGYEKSLIPGMETVTQRRQDQISPGWAGKTRKDISETRLKYRKGKGLRRVRRKSTPGTSLMHVREKDIGGVKEACKSGGVKCEQCGPFGNLHKVRLTGDDGMIESIARKYGKMAQRGSKSMKSNKKALSGVTTGRTYDNDTAGLRQEASRLLKLYCETAFEGHREKAWDLLLQSGFSMGGISRTKQGAEQILKKLEAPNLVTTNHEPPGVKSMKYSKKASPAEGDGASLPNDGGVHAEPATEDVEHEGKDLEPYGAQVLRRVHEHHLILLEEYDEMLQVLENEPVKKHVTQILEDVSEKLDKTESLFEEQYSESGIDGLEGAGDKDLEEEGAHNGTADSGEEEIVEEPTPDEAVEGMMNSEEKHLVSRARKTLRRHYKALKTPYVDGSAIHGQGVPSTPGQESGTVHGQGVPSAPGKQPGVVHAQGKPSGKNFISDETTEVETTKPKGPSKYKPGSEPMQQHEESTVPGGAHGSKDMGVEGSHEPGDEAQTGSELKIHPYEEANVNDAKAFLKAMEDWDKTDDEKRMNAYHFHKLLDPIQNRFEEHFKLLTAAKNFVSDETTKVETTKPSGQLNYSPNTDPMQQHTESTVPGGVAGSKELLWKALQGATKFFKDLASVSVKWTTDHKNKAKELHEALKNFVSDETTEVETTKPSGPIDYKPNTDPMQQHTESTVPGGTAGTKALTVKYAKTNEKIDALSAKIKVLLGK